MRRIAHHTFAGLLAGLALLAPSATGQQAPTVGQPYGPLVLPQVDTGEPFDLMSLRGRRVLLIEFASW